MNDMQRKRFLFILIPLLLLFLLLPFTGFGRGMLVQVSEPANQEGPSEVSSAEQEPEARPDPEPAPAAKTPDFIGEYALTSVSGNGDDIREEDLALIRSLGIPLSLVIWEDGTARLEVFDEAKYLIWAGSCLFEPDSLEQYLFHYQDGFLILHEDNLTFLFEKTG